MNPAIGIGDYPYGLYNVTSMSAKPTFGKTKAELSSQLRDLGLKLQNLQKDFKRIRKQAKGLVVKVHQKRDDQQADALRKKMGLK